MTLTFRVRDFFLPPERVLSEAGIRRGHAVLDFGCGPGSYSLAAANLVGNEGTVYALDINPLAIAQVERITRRRRPGSARIKTILSDCATGLETSTLDVVLLYDTFHDLKHPGAVLNEIHRVLKPGRILSFRDHHMKERDILLALTRTDLFTFAAKGRRTYSFVCKK